MKSIDHKRTGGRDGGFTLIELLVVTSILALLALMAMPAMRKYFRAAVYRKSEVILRQLEGGCYQFEADFDEFPPSGGGNLVKLLAGLSDNDKQEGPGFRTKDRGKVYGPYNGAHQMRMAPAGLTGALYFIDGYENPICYYRFDVETRMFGSDSEGPPAAGGYMRDPSGKFYREDVALCTKGFNRKWDPPSGSSDDVTNFQFK